MSKPNICIALCGKTGSGKDSVADILVNKYGYNKFSFAEPIRELMDKALPNIDYHTNVKARQIMINIAEEPKKLAPKCWAYNLTERIASAVYPRLIVIPDLRFKVELNHLKDTISKDAFDGNGYHILLVNVVSNYDMHIEEIKSSIDNEEDKALLDELENSPSNTEHLSFYFDYILENKRSLDALEQNIEEMLTHFNVL